MSKEQDMNLQPGQYNQAPPPYTSPGPAPADPYRTGYDQYPNQGQSQFPNQGQGQYPNQGQGPYPNQGQGQYPNQGYGQYPNNPTPVVAPTNNVVVVQPNSCPSIIMTNPRPRDMTCLSIMACLFCFWPSGLVAIYFAYEANSAADLGDFPRAIRMNKYSRISVIASMALGIITVVVFSFCYHYLVTVKYWDVEDIYGY